MERDRVVVIPKAGASLDEIRERLTAVLHAYREEEVKTWSSLRPKQDRTFVAAPVWLEGAARGLPARSTDTGAC